MYFNRNEQGQEGMVPSSYVEEIEEAYQDVPDEDESFSSEGANSGNLLTRGCR